MQRTSRIATPRAFGIVLFCVVGLPALIVTAPARAADSQASATNQDISVSQWIETARNKEASLQERVAAIQSLDQAEHADRPEVLLSLADLILKENDASVRIAAIKALGRLDWKLNEDALGALLIAREEGSAKLRAMTTEQMSQRRHFAHVWDLEDVWTIEDGGTYPILKPDPVSADALANGGSGTAEDPWLVATAEQLDAIRNKLGPDAHFRQVADIDLHGYGDPEQGWDPISGQIGSYDGGGYRILNLTINRPRASGVGLFGALNFGDGRRGGHLSRIALENVDIVGGKQVGSLVGKIGLVKQAGLIENCYVTGRVSGTNLVGGLAGDVFGYQVKNSFTAAAVHASSGKASPFVERLWWGSSAEHCFYDADKSELENVCIAAIKVMRQKDVGQDSVPALFRLIRSDNILLRTKAAKLAAGLNPHPDDVTDGLAAALMDDRYDVRRQARHVADACGEQAKADIAASLASVYQRPNLTATDKKRIVRAAGELAVEPAVLFLIEMLADASPDVRAQAIDSLRFLEIPTLSRGQTLNAPSAWWKARPELAKKTMAALQGLASDDPQERIRESAQLALGRISGPSPETDLPNFEPKIGLDPWLPVEERDLLEAVYAEVDACRGTILKQYTQGVAWPFNRAAIVYHASAHLYLNRNLQAANRLLMEHTDLAPYGTEAGGLAAPAWATVYGLYNSQSDHFPGRLTPDAEALFKERMLTYVKWNSEEFFDDYIDDVWKLKGTGNHHVTFGPPLWYLYLGYLNQDPHYASVKLHDGNTVAQWCERWRGYMKDWLAARAMNGFWVELGAGYMKYSIPAIFALYTGADDPEVRQLAQMFLDLYFVEEAQISYGEQRGGSKSRASNYLGSPIAHIRLPLYGQGILFPGHMGLHDAVVCGYRPPPEAILLRKQYERPDTPIQIATRRLGTTTDRSTLKPESGMLNYAYKTRHYLLGSVLWSHDAAVSALFSQKLMNGLIFASGDGVFPDPVALDGRYVDPYYSFQHENVLILQKNKGAYRVGDMRIHIKADTQKTERDGWVFIDDGQAYVAIRMLEGGHRWSEDGNHLIAKNDLTPILIQAGDAETLGSFDDFMTAVLANTVTWDGKVVAYHGPKQPRIEFFTRTAGKLPSVDGREVDLSPPYVYQSPYLKRKADERFVTVTVGPYETVYDFDTKEIKRSIRPRIMTQACRNEGRMTTRSLKVGTPMKYIILLSVALHLIGSPDLCAQTEVSLDPAVEKRFEQALKLIAQTRPPPDLKQGSWLALLDLIDNRNIDRAEKIISEVCGNPLTEYLGKPVPLSRNEVLFRIYLTELTRNRLGPQAKATIEDFAWLLLTEHNRGITRADAEKSFWAFGSSENHYVNNRRRYMQALQIVRMCERYGPDHKLEGQSIESHYQAWVKFWIRYFEQRANEGTDIEIAHPSSYGLCTIGVYYDLYDFADSPRLRELAGNFLTLYWAEVAAEFEPRTGLRALAATRNPFYDGRRTYWAQPLLYAYGWHDTPPDHVGPLMLTFLLSDYRPPEILRAIAGDLNRGPYLATSRRAVMNDENADPGIIIFDENGDSHFRRDVWYTPDYTLSTMTLDPSRQYKHVDLAQTAGVNFSSSPDDRIVVMGTGYYSRRAINGITGAGVSVIARDPDAIFGEGRFKSNGTRVFIRNGTLWDNRVQDESGWFFTRAGDAYAAIHIPAGYTVTTRTFVWPDRKLKEVQENHGHHLELKDMWAPVVIQMGRASEYESFEAFQKSVKDNPIAYQDGRLTYTSEAGETFEYPANSKERLKINSKTVNLNPEKTYDSPFLFMKHGSKKAVISYPGYEDVILKF